MDAWIRSLSVAWADMAVLLPQGGSTTGLSATDALAEPLPVIDDNLLVLSEFHTHLGPVTPRKLRLSGAARLLPPPRAKDVAGLGLHNMEFFARETRDQHVVIMIGAYGLVEGIPLDPKASVGAAKEDRSHALDYAGSPRIDRRGNVHRHDFCSQRVKRYTGGDKHHAIFADVLPDVQENILPTMGRNFRRSRSEASSAMLVCCPPSITASCRWRANSCGGSACISVASEP
jgi:hypothetical protein